MQEAEAICDRIIIINGGKIIADDTAEGIKAISSLDLIPVLVEFLQKVNPEELRAIQGLKEVKSITDFKHIIYCNTDLRPAVF